MKNTRQHSVLCLMIVILQWCFVMSVSAETGVFWKATANDAKTVYIFGTMHSDDNRLTAFTSATLSAIKASDAFMLETEQPKSPTPLLTRRKLSDNLTASELEQVNVLADAYVLPRPLAMHMKPWLLAVIFDAPKPQTPFGQDHLLRSEALNAGKTIIPLESVEEHFGVMDDVTRQEQLSLLKAVLKRTTKEKTRDFEKVLQAYLTGDIARILATNAKTTGNLTNDQIWEKLKKRLILQRNNTMGQRVIASAKKQALFVAVGASHLAGETGLIQQLKDAGFSLEPLQGLKRQ